MLTALLTRPFLGLLMSLLAGLFSASPTAERADKMLLGTWTATTENPVQGIVTMTLVFKDEHTGFVHLSLRDQKFDFTYSQTEPQVIKFELAKPRSGAFFHRIKTLTESSLTFGPYPADSESAGSYELFNHFTFTKQP